MLRFLTVADGLSILNAGFGLLAILAVFSGQIPLAFSLILLALLADGLDGVVARRLGGGQIGDYLEAMADFVSLTVAPAVFVYGIYATGLQPLILGLLLAGMLFFLFCAVTRLSSFHLLKEKEAFLGLPASASTIILVCLAILGPSWFPAFVIFAVLILLGLMQVASLPYPKLGRYTTVVASLVILASLPLTLLGFIAGPLLLLGMILVYVLAGPFFIKKKPA